MGIDPDSEHVGVKSSVRVPAQSSLQGVAVELGKHWNAMLDVLRKSVGHQEVQIWLGDAKPVSESQHEVIVSVPNQYYVDWIEENYRSALEEEAAIRFNRPVSLSFQGEDMPVAQETTSGSPPPTARPSQPMQMGVNKNQTFKNFVVGSCNQFAHAAAGAVAERPASTYNPLFIYGATGLGKTHLMHAIATQPEGEGSRLCRGSRNGADEPFGSEGCKVHLFLFCSFLSHESIQLTRAETGAQTKSAGTGAGTCLICMKC